MSVEVRIIKQVPGFTLDVNWNMIDEVLALFGFSGSGKTMTLQSIAGLIKPDAGFIRVGDRHFFDSASKIDVRTRERRIGYVLQDSALFPHMSVRSNIAYGLIRGERPERAQRVKEMIRLLKLNGFDKAFPHELSGGQKQRVALARALVGKPDILLLDEPFSALDRPIRNKMHEVIHGIRSKFSIPMVLVTHDFHEVEKLADKVVVYSDGRAIQTGSPAELQKNPSGDLVKKLLGIG